MKANNGSKIINLVESLTGWWVYEDIRQDRLFFRLC